jgi:hypothetical protein
VPELKVYDLGKGGVDVQTAPTDLENSELTKAQNAFHDPLGGGLRNRPGLTALNEATAAGEVIGGYGVPLANFFTGTRFFFIGRGPVV